MVTLFTTYYFANIFYNYKKICHKNAFSFVHGHELSLFSLSVSMLLNPCHPDF